MTSLAMLSNCYLRSNYVEKMDFFDSLVAAVLKFNILHEVFSKKNDVILSLVVNECYYF